jgi:hypothetical protein
LHGGSSRPQQVGDLPGPGLVGHVQCDRDGAASPVLGLRPQFWNVVGRSLGDGVEERIHVVERVAVLEQGKVLVALGGARSLHTLRIGSHPVTISIGSSSVALSLPLDGLLSDFGLKRRLVGLHVAYDQLLHDQVESTHLSSFLADLYRELGQRDADEGSGHETVAGTPPRSITGELQALLEKWVDQRDSPSSGRMLSM